MFHLQSLAAGYFESMGVQAELMENGCVDVGDVVAILNRRETEFVCGAVNHAGLDAAAGHSDGEAERVMIATVGAFGAGRAAGLGCPDY